MKIMITYPPLEGRGIPTLGQNRQFQWFSNPSFIYPLVPASAATLLKQAGHAVVWDDCIASGRSVASFWKNLRTAKPDLVAMETKTPVIRQHWDYARNIKAALPGARVVLMGDHVTALPRETLENSPADYAITGGDYDFQLQSIVAHHENGTPLDQGIWYRQDGIILESAAGCATRPLDDLPWIDRTLTRWQDYGEKLYRRKPFTYTMVGRDCPYGKCTFCSWTTLYPRFKVRSPENFIGEIEYLVKELGIREIFDDTGTFPSGGWLESFCGRMRQSGLARRVRLSCNFRYDYLTPARAKMMKASGFRLLKLGLESANQVTLDRLKKGTTVADIERGCRAARKAGLETHLTMMAGYPWETRRQARRTVAFARRLMERGYAAMLQATVIVPYPGTPLYAEAVERDWFLIDPTDYAGLDMSRPVLKTPDMSPEEVLALCGEIYRSFLSPGYLGRQLLSIRNWSDINYYLRGLRPVWGHLRDFSRRRSTC